MKNGLSCAFLRDAARIFENHTLKALNIPFKKVVLPGRVKCAGTDGEIVVAHGCRKTKTLICGMEGEIVVAHGRLPSPTRCTMFMQIYSSESLNFPPQRFEPRVRNFCVE